MSLPPAPPAAVPGEAEATLLEDEVLSLSLAALLAALFMRKKFRSRWLTWAAEEPFVLLEEGMVKTTSGMLGRSCSRCHGPSQQDGWALAGWDGLRSCPAVVQEDGQRGRDEGTSVRYQSSMEESTWSRGTWFRVGWRWAGECLRHESGDAPEPPAGTRAAGGEATARMKTGWNGRLQRAGRCGQQQEALGDGSPGRPPRISVGTEAAWRRGLALGAGACFGAVGGIEGLAR